MRMRSPMRGSVMPGVGVYPRHGMETDARMNPRILGYLGRALSLEFSAGQHYLAQASLANARGEGEFAEGFVALANEEFTHASQITDRMVAHGALPSGSVLRPATPAGDILEALRSCEQREAELIAIYAEASQYCANIGAGEDHQLFARLHQEEQTQLERVGRWLAEHQRPRPDARAWNGGW